MEGKRNVFRVDRQERQENGTNAVVQTLLLQFIQIVNDVLCRDTIGAQTVRSGQDQQVHRVQWKYILLKTLQCCMGGIAATSEIEAFERQVCCIAVFEECGRA